MAPEGETIYSDRATHIEIEDEGGGEFIAITQFYDSEKASRLVIDKDEWPHIRNAVDKLMEVVRDENP